MFDCDGVLVDSEEAVFAGIVAVFARRGIDGLVTGPSSRLYGASVDKVISELERELGKPVDVEEVAEELDSEIRRAIASGVRAMAGAIELLEAIRGIAPAGGRIQRLSRDGRGNDEVGPIPQVFDAVVVLEAPLRPKPAPDLYLRACELLEVAPDGAIALEDSVPGARSAGAAGLMVVGVGAAPGLGFAVDTLVPDLGDPELLNLLGLETLQV